LKTIAGANEWKKIWEQEKIIFPVWNIVEKEGNKIAF